MAEIPQIQERAAKPAGLLPKNVQAWLLVGLAFLMVAIMWLTGGKKPPAPAKSLSAAPAAEAPLEVNETRITELQNRIEELQRQQLVAQNALAQQTRLLGAATQDPQESSQPQSGVIGPSEQQPEDPIAAERKRRAYVSLFSSNVALSYRMSPSHAASLTEAPAAAATPRRNRHGADRSTLERSGAESGSVADTDAK